MLIDGGVSNVAGDDPNVARDAGEPSPGLDREPAVYKRDPIRPQTCGGRSFHAPSASCTDTDVRERLALTKVCSSSSIRTHSSEPDSISMKNVERDHHRVDHFPDMRPPWRHDEGENSDCT